jgi:hypothetical protein
MNGKIATVVLLSSAVLACVQGKAKEEDPQRCASCHMDEVRAVTKPPHLGTLPTTCGVCHSQDSWKPSVLDHAWALTGAHAQANCFQCHTGANPKFVGTPKLCFGCHKPDYEKAPGHVARKFPQKCEKCHSTTNFTERLENAPAAPGSDPKPKPPKRKGEPPNDSPTK